MSDEAVTERPDDDDHDLLTFGEAGARLTEEVAKQRHEVDRLRAASAPADEVARAEARLSALREAVLRNRKPTLHELHASGFFRRLDG